MISIKQWFTTNSGLKIVALALAIVTWFFVKSVTSETRSIENVPIEVLPKPSLTLVQTSVSTITVVVRGTHDDVRQMSREMFSAALDLRNIDKIGTHTVRIGTEIVRHPPRVQVTQVVPGTMTVKLDETIERSLIVKPLLTGEVPAGWVVEATNIVPAQVRVRGPRSVLDNLQEIETLPIDLTNRRISFRERVQLALPDPNLSLVRLNAVEADLRIAESNK
jgi:YbbR domain-containing protein